MAKTRRTWQPKKLKRIRKHGFMERLKSPGGKNVLKRRARKGRKMLAIKISSK